MKKWIFILINTLGIFCLCFLIHPLFEWIPNQLTSIFFPVNESIWEHMKMIFTAYAIWTIILLIGSKKWKKNNYFFSFLLTSVLNIILYLIIYLPIYHWIGENMLITLTLLFATIFLLQILAYFILTKKDYKWLEILSIALIPICFTIFGYLTYYPIKTELFFDPIQKKYGLSTLLDE